MHREAQLSPQDFPHSCAWLFHKPDTRSGWHDATEELGQFLGQQVGYLTGVCRLSLDDIKGDLDELSVQVPSVQRYEVPALWQAVWPGRPEHDQKATALR
jgi:hypothetical protein